MEIERVGKTTGRWPKYFLVVDGVNVGQIARTIQAGSDRMAPQQYDGWAIGGRTLCTRDEAEAALIERAKRFGHIK